MSILFLLLGFLFGFIISNIVRVPIIQAAQADVAGMDRYDLRYDYEFKDAVKYIVEDDCQAEPNGEISCR